MERDFSETQVVVKIIAEYDHMLQKVMIFVTEHVHSLFGCTLVSMSKTAVAETFVWQEFRVPFYCQFL